MRTQNAECKHENDGSRIFKGRFISLIILLTSDNKSNKDNISSKI